MKAKQSDASVKPPALPAASEGAAGDGKPSVVEAALRRRLDFEQLILTLSTRFINLPDSRIDAEIADAVRIIGRFQQVDRCYVFRFDLQAETIRNTHEWCAPGVVSQIDDFQNNPFADQPWVVRQLCAGQAIVCPSIDRLPDEARLERELFQRVGIRSVLLVPMQVRDHTIGFMGFDSVFETKNWSEDDVLILRMTANVFAAALDRCEGENARKRNEDERRRLVAAIEQAVEVIIITDPDGTIHYVNPAFQVTTGYRADEAIGQNPRMLNSGEQGAAVYRDIWGTLAKGRTWRGRLVNRHKDGTLYTTETSLAPVRDSRGRTVNYVSVQTDITDHLELEAQYRQAQKMEAVGRLSGTMAHDFNNLLQVVLGHAEYLHAVVGETFPHQDALKAIIDTVDHAANLTRQLLTFARRQRTNPERIALNRSIASMIPSLDRLVGERIRLDWRPSTGLWPILMDPTHIDQILLNLSLNARDAMEGQGTITLETENVRIDEQFRNKPPDAASGDYVCLRFADTGKGMDDETLNMLFEPFFTTKPPGKGTGLGLSTIYGIVGQCNGFILVDSEPGAGSTFHLYFPRAKR